MNQLVILCVDDELGNLKLLERTLGQADYLVLKACDGWEALEIIGSRRVDLVLTDVLMPGVNGFEICRRIKEDERYRHIPVVMITALGSKADRIRGIEVGADDFLAKPFDPSEVQARVKMLLRTKQLDEMLNDTYRNIQDLTSFGSQIMNSFRPAGFNLMAQVDSLADQIIGKDAEAVGRPKTVLVHLSGSQKLAWHHYVYNSGRLELSGIDLFSSPTISDRDIDACFCNLPWLSPKFKPLVERLATIGIAVENMACYFSNTVSVIALNYGRDVRRFDAAVLENLAMQTHFFTHLAFQIRENEDALAYTVHSLARAAEVNDEDTGDHILRVGEFCAIVAKRLGLEEQLVDTLRLQAALHDVGKLHIPSEILKKPGALDLEERDYMKRHCEMGAKIIGDHPKFKVARQIALSHHERWDGTGYPFGYSGDRIPLVGRIMNIADQYDALRNARIYKPAIDHATTVKIIVQGDQRTMPHHFDPQVLQAFVDTAPMFEEMYEKMIENFTHPQWGGGGPVVSGPHCESSPKIKV